MKKYLTISLLYLVTSFCLYALSEAEVVSILDRAIKEKTPIEAVMLQHRSEIKECFEQNPSRTLFRELAFRLAHLGDQTLLVELGQKIFSPQDFVLLSYNGRVKMLQAEGMSQAEIKEFELSFYDYFWFLGAQGKLDMFEAAYTYLKLMEQELKLYKDPAPFPVLQQIRHQIYTKYGHLKIREKKYAEALEYFDRAIKITAKEVTVDQDARKENAYALQEKAYALILLERNVEAKEILDSLEFQNKTIFLHPNYRRFQLYRAQIYLQEKEFEKAKILLEAYPLDPGANHRENLQMMKELKIAFPQ